MPVTMRVENCVIFLHVHHSHSIVIYHRYDLDMTGPLVAQPQQPSTKAHPPPLTHAAHSKNAATAAVINLEIEGEIQMLLDYIDRQVVTFAKRFTAFSKNLVRMCFFFFLGIARRDLGAG